MPKSPNPNQYVSRSNIGTLTVYIAPEFTNGSSKPSVETDTFALCFLVKTVYRLLKFDPFPTVENALKQPSRSQPSIAELKEALNAKWLTVILESKEQRNQRFTQVSQKLVCHVWRLFI